MLCYQGGPTFYKPEIKNLQSTNIASDLKIPYNYADTNKKENGLNSNKLEIHETSKQFKSDSEDDKPLSV
jgi:hypothetical protein